jgi:SAM-dependent methyltransferase
MAPAPREALLKRIRSYIDRRYPGWNLDAALRYLPVAEHLDSSDAARVLDVGSAGEGLSLYWKRKVFELDLRIRRRTERESLCPVAGSGLALPFRNGSFDVVVSLDVLEHLRPEDRPTFVSEMIRVAQRECVLGVPCGLASHRAEEEVDRIYRQKNGESHLWLREHLLYGLPEADRLSEEIRSCARGQGKGACVRIQGNTNLRLWKWLFRQYFAGGPRTARFIRYYLLALIPLLRHVHWGRTYRKIFFVRLSPHPVP